jgi:hypothetical protein
VARRLVEDYLDVLAPHGDPVMIAGRLVSDRRIVPVLDGLDELPAADHTVAMDALDKFAAMERPLVVTCRFHEYVRAVARGRVLSQAAVVELEPVDVEDAIRYLSEPAPDSRWDAVFGHLREQPNGELARALSTPLMVALARTAYQDRASTPDELVKLSTESRVTGRLMDAFVASVYTDSTPRRRDESRRSYPAERSRAPSSRRWRAVASTPCRPMAMAASRRPRLPPGSRQDPARRDVSPTANCLVRIR